MTDTVNEGDVVRRSRLALAESALLRAGYRRSCDIPACNCGDQWVHGGHANERLRELAELLDAFEFESRGGTILQRVERLLERLAP